MRSLRPDGLLGPRLILTVALLALLSTSSCSRTNDYGLAPNLPSVSSSYSAPVWHPSGRTILFNHEPLVRAYWDPTDNSYHQVFAESLLGYWVVNADGSGQRRIASAYLGDADWDPTGTKLAYSPGGTLFTIAGSDTSVSFDSPTEIGSGISFPSWSPDGSMIAGSWNSSIEILLVAGGTRRTIGEPWRQPDWSLHGDSLVFAASKVDRVEIAVADSSGQGIRTLWGQDGSNASYPRWSPDGSKIAFTGRANNSDFVYRLWIMDSSGTNAHPLTTEGSLDFFSWSPNGQEIAYVRYNYGDTSLTNGTIWIVNVASGAKRQLTFNTPSN